MLRSTVKFLPWLAVLLIYCANATENLEPKPSFVSGGWTDGKQHTGYAGRIIFGATFAPTPLLPSFEYSLETPFRKSDFYFYGSQKLVVGKNAIIQLWPCDKTTIEPRLHDFQQLTVELLVDSMDKFIGSLWLADNLNSRLITGNNFQGLGRIHHQIQGALMGTLSKNGAKLVVNAKFKGISKNAYDGIGNATFAHPFEFKLEGELLLETSILRMNELTDCRGILGLREPAPCKVGELCTNF